MQLGKYRHYKWNFYEVIGIAKHSETLEDMVVYKALYVSPEFGKDALRIRPKAMFESDVEVDGTIVKRFTHIEW